MIADTAYHRNRNYLRATDLPETPDHKRKVMAVDGLLRPLPVRFRLPQTSQQ